MEYYVNGLSSEEREGRLVSLYALKNAAQPYTLPNILALAKDDEDMDLIEIAVDAMSQFDAELFTEEVRTKTFFMYSHLYYHESMTIYEKMWGFA